MKMQQSPFLFFPGRTLLRLGRFGILLLFPLLLSCRAKGPALAPDLASLKCNAAEPQENTLVLTDGKTEVKLVSGSKSATVASVPIALTSPVEKTKGIWIFPDGKAQEVLFPLLRPVPRKIRTILLDPGHGGKDEGAKGVTGKQEKELNLSLALALGEELEKAGFQVKMTRRDDSFVELGKRGSLTVPCGADLFLSLHHNSSAVNPAASGAECFVINPSEGSAREFFWMSRSIRLAFLIQQEQAKVTGSLGRGVKFARFRVLKDAECPAVLVEAGFLSNAAEEKWCADPQNQKAFAEAVTRAVRAYAGL